MSELTYKKIYLSDLPKAVLPDLDIEESSDTAPDTSLGDVLDMVMSDELELPEAVDALVLAGLYEDGWGKEIGDVFRGIGQGAGGFVKDLGKGAGGVVRSVLDPTVGPDSALYKGIAGITGQGGPVKSTEPAATAPATVKASAYLKDQPSQGIKSNSTSAPGVSSSRASKYDALGMTPGSWQDASPSAVKPVPLKPSTSSGKSVVPDETPDIKAIGAIRKSNSEKDPQAPVETAKAKKVSRSSGNTLSGRGRVAARKRTAARKAEQDAAESAAKERAASFDKWQQDKFGDVATKTVRRARRSRPNKEYASRLKEFDSTYKKGADPVKPKKGTDPFKPELIMA